MDETRISEVRERAGLRLDVTRRGGEPEQHVLYCNTGNCREGLSVGDENR